MNKIYKLVPKNLVRPRTPLIFGKNRFNTYDFHEPKCEFCSDALFFIVGMYFGYHIGKDRRY